MLRVVELPRSVFYYHQQACEKPDKQAEIKELIKQIFDEHKGRYGYRRIASALQQRGQQIHQNTVLKLMKALGLKSAQRQKKYASYKGGVGETAPNLLNREFEASKPNEKWVTDVTEFKVGDEKLYFSPIKDLFNGEIVAHAMHTRPVLDMVMSMLKKAARKLGKEDKPLLHSDQGWHYRMKNYRSLLRTYNIGQSMSRKGNCYDNAAMESFFAVVKTECFHGRKFKTIDELKAALVAYVRYYNHERISQKLGGLSPVQYRLRHAAI